MNIKNKLASWYENSTDFRFKLRAQLKLRKIQNIEVRTPQPHHPKSGSMRNFQIIRVYGKQSNDYISIGRGGGG